MSNLPPALHIAINSINTGGAVFLFPGYDSLQPTRPPLNPGVIIVSAFVAAFVLCSTAFLLYHTDKPIYRPDHEDGMPFPVSFHLEDVAPKDTSRAATTTPASTHYTGPSITPDHARRTENYSKGQKQNQGQKQRERQRESKESASKQIHQATFDKLAGLSPSRIRVPHPYRSHSHSRNTTPSPPKAVAGGTVTPFTLASHSRESTPPAPPGTPPPDFTQLRDSMISWESASTDSFESRETEDSYRQPPNYPAGPSGYAPYRPRSPPQHHTGTYDHPASLIPGPKPKPPPPLSPPNPNNPLADLWDSRPTTSTSLNSGRRVRKKKSDLGYGRMDDDGPSRIKVPPEYAASWEGSAVSDDVGGRVDGDPY